ncbi:flagellin [Inediibacterium massiliense]|uniref:flagellin N-terminal helical domain-containing protein n=1 Tax=Inediibacterium massiliense TaxID=1658111 RepID=UPI0006B49E0E|nr:flagellin [Inediibacterium massiliense]
MIINHNMMAMNTHRQMGINQGNGSKSIEKLSSGLRINRAGDDAAGLSISEKMRAQIRGLDQASRNAQDGISMIQTAEGALQETHAILQRMRELAVQSSSDTNVDVDRDAIQGEITQLKSEIDRIGDTTEFNTKKLLNGNLSSAGAAGGVNAVSGAQVFKQTSGSLTGVAAAAVNASGANLDMTAKDALVIDGEKITIDWNKHLTAEDKAVLNADYSTTNLDATTSGKVRDIMERVINASIDESGTGASHIKITDSTAGTFKIESTAEGNDSKVELYHGTDGAATAKLADGTTTAVGAKSVLSLYVGANAEMAGGAVTQTSGTNQVLDAMAGTDKFQLSIDGHTMEITSPVAAAGSDANTYATALQTAINTAIGNYNTAAGFTSEEQKIKDVAVSVENGRLTISSPSGPVDLQDVTNGDALSKLGLDQASRQSGATGAVTFQIGANKGQTMGLSINDMRTGALGINGIDLSTQTGASESITKLETAIKNVSSERSKLGAVQNRLEHTIKNLDTSSENLQASESRIRDVDMAKEMMSFQKNNILQQAAQAMLAQANQAPQGVLQLLR